MPGAARVLVAIGSLAAVIAGLHSIITGEPVIAALTGGAFLGGLRGGVVEAMGVVGVLGGALALYSTYSGSWRGAVAGGILGLAAPCGLSLLAIIGGVLMRRSG